MRTLLLLPALTLLACGSSSTVDAGMDAGLTVDAGPDPLVVARPYDTVVPVGYTAGTPLPLIVLLHGYTATAATQDAYFKLSAAAQTHNFLLALPNGTIDGNGQHFWNATDACCGFGATVDDVAYLTAVIADVAKHYTVDPHRIFLVGHSNGAFMSHRMACDRSTLIAAAVALAGDNWADTAKCQPTTPVSMLQVHGTLDSVISYTGGSAVAGAPPFPSAADSMTTWATKNGCTATARSSIGGDLDLVVELIGNDTKREGWAGCPTNGAAELWSIQGGSHVPGFNSSWADTIVTWLYAHPKQ
jgi:polyhydroxybutyrate depolymerase